jgi:hypothetical protein
MPKNLSVRVGEIRPSQLLFTYGIGALVDLPKLSVIVTGLEDWPQDPNYVHPVVEDRLLQAIRYFLPDVQKMYSPPLVPESGLFPDPLDSSYRMGVPVAAFPRWMLCPECRLLAPLSSGLFELKEELFHPDRTVYRHTGCNKAIGRMAPEVVPARFLVACEKGHLDDFPWVDFTHNSAPCSHPVLHMYDVGPTGEARDVQVQCMTCGKKRRMAEAFGKDRREKMPQCRGRRPQLRDFDPEPCEHNMRAVALGASNSWFSVVQTTIAIPVQSGRLPSLVAERWDVLQEVTNAEMLGLLRRIGQLGGELSQFSDGEIWETIETKRRQDSGLEAPPSEQLDLKTPEWEVLTQHDPALNSEDFRLRPVPVPERFRKLIKQVVLVERLREVRAMIGFTRIDSVGELTDPDLGIETDIAPIARRSPTWVPAIEVRGEGIFIEFHQDKLDEWERSEAIKARARDFFDAHKRWRKFRQIEPPEVGFPGMRYVLLHSFSHALMRQLSLECGYSAASISERIYSKVEKDAQPGMAGILIYTSAPDSEGTLGGLVSMGETENLGWHLLQALEAARLCASDPLCAEHPPSQRGQTLHAAACHACLFAPETACERGNKYLDRSALVHTVEIENMAFFE